MSTAIPTGASRHLVVAKLDRPGRRAVDLLNSGKCQAGNVAKVLNNKTVNAWLRTPSPAALEQAPDV